MLKYSLNPLYNSFIRLSINFRKAVKLFIILLYCLNINDKKARFDLPRYLQISQGHEKG